MKKLCIIGGKIKRSIVRFLVHWIGYLFTQYVVLQVKNRGKGYYFRNVTMPDGSRMTDEAFENPGRNPMYYRAADGEVNIFFIDSSVEGEYGYGDFMNPTNVEEKDFAKFCPPGAYALITCYGDKHKDFWISDGTQDWYFVIPEVLRTPYAVSTVKFNVDDGEVVLFMLSDPITDIWACIHDGLLYDKKFFKKIPSLLYTWIRGE